MKYELTTPHFIVHTLYKAGTIIEYNGEPNPGMIPLDDEAVERMAKYYKDHPNASLNPVNDLPLAMEVPRAAAPTPIVKADVPPPKTPLAANPTGVTASKPPAVTVVAAPPAKTLLKQPENVPPKDDLHLDGKIDDGPQNGPDIMKAK